VTPILVGLALVVVLGATIAVSAALPRVAALGVIVVLAGAPFVADPLPSVPAIAARIVAAVLGGYILWIALRRAPATRRESPLEWPGQLAVASAALIAGSIAAVGLGEVLAAAGPRAGELAQALRDGSMIARAGLAASIALAVLAAGPVVAGRDVLRVGLGLLLLIGSVDLLVSAAGPPIDSLLELALAALVVAAAAGVAWTTRQALRMRDDLDVYETPRPEATRRRMRDEAQPSSTSR
jgi:hypothetical protein